ncbi:hypothetical protein G4228_003754 [Cervus hanglu yarkandensis]|nr:hypothetical protein G4228_003754 [Cervus hanglu yarkandensis]
MGLQWGPLPPLYSPALLSCTGQGSAISMAKAGGLWELVSKLLHLHFKDKKTKVSGDALQLMAELLKIFVVEAAIRSVRQAQAEELDHVDVEQLEKVLPQLVGGPPEQGLGGEWVGGPHP